VRLHLKGAKSWAWWCPPVIPSYVLGKKQDLISKITRAKRAGGVAQGVEFLTPKHKALSSNPSKIYPQSLLRFALGQHIRYRPLWGGLKPSQYHVFSSRHMTKVSSLKRAYPVFLNHIWSLLWGGLAHLSLDSFPDAL
jgi:hypothetical protein